MMSRIRLTKPAYLAAASLVTGKDKTRSGIQGVSIEKAPGGGVYLVATDARCLVAFLDREGHADENCIMTVTRPLFSAIRFQAKSPDLRLEVEQDILRVLDGKNEKPSHMQSLATIDGRYPDWRRAVPDIDRPSGAVAFNAGQLGYFSRVLDTAFGTGKRTSIRLIGGGDGASLITAEHPDWFGVLMPVRSAAGVSIPFSIERGAA